MVMIEDARILACMPLKKGLRVEPSIFGMEDVDDFLICTADATKEKGWFFTGGKNGGRMRIEGRETSECLKDDNITYCYRRLRKAFLKSDYDYMLCVENDVLPPRNAVWELLSTSMAFKSQFGEEPAVSAVIKLHEAGGLCNMVSVPETRKHGADSWVTITAVPWAVEAYNSGQPFKVDFTGTSLLLLHRDIVKAVDWGVSKRFELDIEWSLRMAAAKKEILLHPGVRCGHRNTDGSVSWPQQHYSKPPEPVQSSDDFEKEWGRILDDMPLKLGDRFE